MKTKVIRHLIAGAILVVGTSRADVKVDIAEAAHPMDEGVPEVAVIQLRQLVAALPAGDASLAKEKLAEALLAAQQPEDALRVLDNADMRGLAAGRLFRAEALALLKRLDEALRVYREIANDPGSGNRGQALFGAAEMLRALGRSDEALGSYRSLENDARFGIPARLREAEVLLNRRDGARAKHLLDQTQPKSTADKRVKRLLRARLELLEQRPEKAIALLDSLAKKPAGTARETVIAALFAMADAHMQLKTPESGDDYLEDFIEQHPNDPDLAQVFAKLDEVYRAERKPPRNELEKWARDTPQPRRGLGRWYLAQMELRANRPEDAIRQFEQIRSSLPVPAALAPALVQYARLLNGNGKFEDALAVLTTARQFTLSSRTQSEIDFESGHALYGARQFDKAGVSFENVAATERQFAAPAFLNASLAWLQTGQIARAEADKKELGARGEKDAAAEVALEQALGAANRKEKNAADMLQQFVRQFPDHARVSEAYLTLAELAFHAASPQLDNAEKYFAAARAAHPGGTVAEKADYLAIWLADARGADSDRVIASANDFLHKYPQSTWTPEVRMKLAETHFRRQDFANAQTQFETLAQENPKSAWTEKAVFLAAESAVASMANRSLERALELLTQVVKMEGELRWAARNEQAAIERRLGKAQDAQVLYDEVLKGDARGAEKREALCGKADIFLEQASTDSGNLGRAVALYDQLAGETPNQPHWRNQALFKKGVCLEKQSDIANALVTFYRILEFNPAPDKPPEFFWFYKAGFNAARLLEEQQKWDSAASIYEKLVMANGPRSEEAQARLTQLRLEHFLWQD